jgi:hypothetical protein
LQIKYQFRAPKVYIFAWYIKILLNNVFLCLLKTNSNPSFQTNNSNLFMKKKNRNDVSWMLCLNKASGILLLSFLIFFSCLLVAPSSAMGQTTKTVKGKVVSTSGELLPGVSIVVKGTTTGTVTDMDGKYTLPNVPANSKLVFSFIGFTASEVAFTNQAEINVTLQEDTKQIEEVVAIGYGTAKKRDLTGKNRTASKRETAVGSGSSSGKRCRIKCGIFFTCQGWR